MGFVFVLACTVAAVWLLRGQIAKRPWAFYVLAALCDALYVGSVWITYPGPLRAAVFLLMQKCTLAFALFVVVMFIGVFRKNSTVDLALRPVRAELSILACILALGHVLMYLASFAPRVLDGELQIGFLLFCAVCLCLLALLAVLGVTSLKVVKRRMPTSVWKRVQTGAYVFFGLVYAHIVVILLPSALANGATAQMSIVLYTIVFGAYAALRIRRAVVDKPVVRDELPHPAYCPHA